MAQMAFVRHNGLTLMAHTDKPPAEAEWNDYLSSVKDEKISQIMIFTDGGGPTAAQRKELKDALGGRTMPSAVVADAMGVRFIVSSVALFNKGIRSFGSSHFADAV